MAVKKVKEVPKVYRTYEDYPFEDLCTYAGIDCLVTSQLLAKIFPLVAEQKAYTFSKSGQAVPGTAPAILDFMHSVEMPAHEFIIDMELNGLKYDVQKSRATRKLIEAELPELEERIFSLIGKKVNLDSGKELGGFLYGELGFEPVSFTKHNEPSTDGDAILGLYKKHKLEWLSVLARRNNLASVYRTFFKSYEEDFVKSDGRIHPSYNLFGTSSYRITGDRPNLTQLPNEVTEKRLGYSIKENYIVDKGEFFLCADWSSAEVKVLGFLCKCPKLLKAIEEEKDFHSYSAASMHGVPYEDFVSVLEYEGSDAAAKDLKGRYKALRQGAKQLTFGILFGSSVKGIAFGLGISESEAQRLIAIYFKEFPLIEVYVKDSHRMAQWNNYVMNAFGQAKRQFGSMPMYRDTAVFNASLRNSQNCRIQSTASTAGLYAFTGVNRSIKPLGGKSLCTVYDSIEVSGPWCNAALIVEEVFYNMNDKVVADFEWMDLPIGADVEIGLNWGELTKVKRGITQEEIFLMFPESVRAK